jgi:hypothetical protein
MEIRRQGNKIFIYGLTPQSIGAEPIGASATARDEAIAFFNEKIIELTFQMSFPKFGNCVNNSIVLKANVAQEFLPDNPSRIYALIQNNGEVDVTLALGSDCEFGKGIVIKPGGNYEITCLNLYVGVLTAIAEFNCEISYSECVS